MAARGDLHQRGPTASGLVPYRNTEARVYSAPLLPYERDLIATIGCSEDEYRWYRARVATQSRIRPAEYSNIPNVQNTGLEPWLVSTLISLAIGVASTAAAYFLTPRPETPARQRSRTLASANGRSRFNQTFGFEGAADIAEYGLPIPIVWGRYEQRESHTTGGILVTPSLVWSRMLSHGGSQGYKGLYVVGETTLTAPEVAGIYLGSMPLSSLPPQQYAFYWASRDGDNRVKAADLFAGTRGDKTAGDPEPYDDIFQCPTLQAMVDTGFCSVYTPTGSTTFGAYDPIKNGTHNKINWQVVSLPDNKDPERRIHAMRRKIAGGAANQLKDGMRGEGAGYSCFMGTIGYKSVNGVYTEYQYPTRVKVAVGDEIAYRINDTKYNDEDKFDPKSGVTLDDQDQRTIKEREETDDKLQIGELFIIGRTVWQVTQRPADVWRRKGGPATYILKCVELTGGSNEIGIAGVRAITEQIGYNGNNYEPQWLGPSYFPLLRVAFATVRNQRPVDVTEFGIKSQVWNRANGLCNFPEVPTPARLIKFDEAGTTLTTGLRNSYMRRTSVFTIQLRPVGLAPNGQLYPWSMLGEQFCVTGQSPVDQYNFIRIKSRVRGQFEYRIIPKTGADVRLFSPDDTQFLRLNANGGELIGADYATDYGQFRVTVVGEWVAAIDVRSNEEFRTKGKSGTDGNWVNQAARMEVVAWLPSYLTSGKFGGWHTHYLGNPKDYKNQERSAVVTLTWTTGKTVDVRITAVSQYRQQQSLNDGWEWRNPSTMTIVGWSHEPPDNYEFETQVAVNNAFAAITTGPRLRVVHDAVYVKGDPATEERWFETSSQIADVSHYEELEKSNSSNPEHEIVYVNESVGNEETPTYNAMTMFGMALRSSRSVTSLEQVRMWIPNGVPAYRFDFESVGPANKFSDLVYFLLTDTRMGAGRRVSSALVDTAGFQRTSRFLVQNRIYFDGVIEEQTNIREFISGTAPLHLCNFVIANGKFSMEPALPTNADGTLDQDAIPISALFTAGNIIEDSFAVTYSDLSERQDFRAVMTYQERVKNQLPESRSLMVLWADLVDSGQAKVETFDLSSFCTYREQAFMTARYLLSVRRRVTHEVSFKTTPEGLYLAPGQYIRVITKASPSVSYQNGVIDATGNVTSLSGDLAGTYNIFAYRTGDNDVRETTLTVTNGVTSDSSLYNSLFTVKADTANDAGQSVYQVTQITMDEDGLVEIQATHHPCDSLLRSRIVQDVLDTSLFTVLD